MLKVPRTLHWGFDIGEDEEPKNSLEPIDNHVYFYGAIFGSMSGIVYTLQALDRMLREQKREDPIVLHIDSPGGDVFSGFKLADAILGLKTPVHVIGEGYVASAATIVAMAADKFYMTPNAYFMVHQLSSIFFGTYEDFKDEMHLQNMVMDQIVGFYTKKTGLSNEAVREMLQRDSWMNAEQAVSMRFSDGIIGKSNTESRFSFLEDTMPRKIKASDVPDELKEEFEEEVVEEEVVEEEIVEEEQETETVFQTLSLPVDFNDIHNSINQLSGAVSEMAAMMSKMAEKIELMDTANKDSVNDLQAAITFVADTVRNAFGIKEDSGKSNAEKRVEKKVAKQLNNAYPSLDEQLRKLRAAGAFRTTEL